MNLIKIIRKHLILFKHEYMEAIHIVSKSHYLMTAPFNDKMHYCSTSTVMGCN